MSNRALAALTTALALSLTAAIAQPPQLMREVMDALLTLVPTLLQPGRLESSANPEAVDAALATLAASADAFDRHGAGFDASYDRVRRSFAEDTREALRAYRDGDIEVSRFLLRHLTENCFDCHSRLPAADRSDLSAAFARAIDPASLPAGEHMRLLVATRQFEAARLYAESLLADPDQHPALIDSAGIFEDYFKVCLRVERDFDRARAALQGFHERDDLPVYLSLQLGDWVRALQELQGFDTTDQLAAAEQLLREAQERNLYLQDRRGLVHATLASGLLHGFVLTAPPGPASTARAYYLLGLAESTIARSHWVPETEYYLELAVRSAPGTETARDAYVFLEQFVIATYTGSAGTDMPQEVWQRLRQLRDLAFR